ncbi:uncharacterized protein LOC131874547 [Cryptomeria japonica]|uniref:uncharacterized protein LOC131874547 n=1 Tax=Cryptomeria japonica TaxID=3369 RepID=UPI0027DA2761|nr:uncharacterized protein LOC131874547 [Cryptomeria japonica]
MVARARNKAQTSKTKVRNERRRNFNGGRNFAEAKTPSKKPVKPGAAAATTHPAGERERQSFSWCTREEAAAFAELNAAAEEKHRTDGERSSGFSARRGGGADKSGTGGADRGEERVPKAGPRKNKAQPKGTPRDAAETEVCGGGSGELGGRVAGTGNKHPPESRGRRRRKRKHRRGRFATHRKKPTKPTAREEKRPAGTAAGANAYGEETVAASNSRRSRGTNQIQHQHAQPGSKGREKKVAKLPNKETSRARAPNDQTRKPAKP